MNRRSFTREQILRAFHPDTGRTVYGPAIERAWIPLVMLCIGLTIFAPALAALVRS